MITLLEAAIKSGAKEVDIEVKNLYQLLPFTPIPGGALSYEKQTKNLSLEDSIHKIISEDK